ncbi:MAG: hypothetical protein WCC12_17700 [Anaerolineales bacterium]
MIPKLTKLFLLLFILQLLLPARVVLADTGPKPSMDFEFQQELAGDLLTIASGVMYECEQPDCSDASPLEELGPQRFECEADSCYAMAYGFSPYHRLELEFSDGKTRQSNIFETAGFDSKYVVTVRPDDLLVESQFSIWQFPRTSIFVVACLCCVAGLVLLAALIIFAVNLSRKS